MHWSRFGQRFTQSSGILELMQDLDLALNQSDQDLLMLGGGNPCQIPEMEDLFRQIMQAILNTFGSFESLVGIYDHPGGDSESIAHLADFLSLELGWPVSPEHIALSNGSQHSFFNLFSILAGEMEDGSFRRILLPMCPEYIGYADTGIHAGLFLTRRPAFEFSAPNEFIYQLPFGSLQQLCNAAGSSIGALCVSRPANPTGRMLADADVDRLLDLAKSIHVPLIVDGAYGLPFPGIVFDPAGSVQAVWRPGMIMTLSLSKFGLPGTRTGIVIAEPHIITLLGRMNAITNLATGSLGPALLSELLQRKLLLECSRNIIQPHYAAKSRQAQSALHEAMQSRAPDVEYAVHQSQGAFFLWLWLRNLPVTTRVLYNELKRSGVLVVPGEYYFPGMEEDDWQHKHECIRISFAQDPHTVARGVEIIAQTAQRLVETGNGR
ncbi:MAG: valine--pyruvate transaminase [Leptospiraceae bacterium]|nr:valine--pyruvate transaminase [Leptospiraceae bacterium]